MNHLRKTHPMVLIAAIALTIFSLVGSAAISGLIPSAPQSEVRNRTIPMNEEAETATTKPQYRQETVEQIYQRTQRLPQRTHVVIRT